MDYQTVRTESGARNEHRDCAVVATSLVTGTPYNQVHNIMKKFGRKTGKGTPWHIIENTLRELGYQMCEQPFSDKTVRTFERNDRRVFPMLIRVRGHVLASVRGKVQDWTQGRCHRILAVYKIKQKTP